MKTPNNILAFTLLGLTSGLPFCLVTSTLQAFWTTTYSNAVGATALGLINLIYLMKPIWSHIYDKPNIRNNLIGYLQLFILISCLTTGLLALSFGQSYHLILALAILLALASANQDLVQDGLRIIVNTPEKLATVNAWFISGYRLAIVISGGIVLIIADHYSWQFAYLSMAGLMLSGSIALNFVPKPPLATTPTTNFLQTWKLFSKNINALNLLIFVIIYRMVGEIMLITWMPFVFDKLHFSLSEVAIGIKGVALIMQIPATIGAGKLIEKYGCRRCLLWFALYQLIAICTIYYLCVLNQPSLHTLYLVMALEQISSAITGLVVITAWMQIINRQFATSQFAILAAALALDRIIGSGFIATLLYHTNWNICFGSLVFLCLPPIIYLKIKQNTPPPWLMQLG